MVPRVTESARVIVIGSGPAGSAAAVFLSRAGADVLVLEAGSERDADGLTVRIGGFTVLKRRRALKECSDFAATGDPKTEFFEDIAPGGLSNHWSCAVPRFSEEDFADAERAGEATTWPIGYADLTPWYERVEPFLRIAAGTTDSPHLPAGVVRHARNLGPDWAPLAAEARACGRDLTPMPYAYGAETTATQSGTVFNAYVRILKPEVRAGRVQMQYDARVVRLEWSPEARRVSGVVVRDANGSQRTLPCRAVVVAAGALRTPTILQASACDAFPAGLGNEHGVLGHYLHDHPLGKIVVDLGRSVVVHPPSYFTRQALDAAPPLYTAACMQWSGSDMFSRSVMRGTPGRLSWIGFSVFGTMAPVPDNWVAIDDKAPASSSAGNGHGMPRLTLHVNHPPEAKTALEKARDDLMQALKRAGMQPVLRTWDINPVGESKHYGGTCRMHASPKYGMIDRLNRLHAVPNVAVVDSSCFTTGPEKNPVVTAMAIAARAGHHLATDLQAGAFG
jgi:choline dehydrogenase-like flavoprotein